MIVLSAADIEVIEDCDRKQDEWLQSVQDKDNMTSRVKLTIWLEALEKRRQTVFCLPSGPLSVPPHR